MTRRRHAHAHADRAPCPARPPASARSGPVATSRGLIRPGPPCPIEGTGRCWPHSRSPHQRDWPVPVAPPGQGSPHPPATNRGGTELGVKELAQGPPPDGVFMDTFVSYTHTTGGETDGDGARGGGRHCRDTHRTDFFTLAPGTAKLLAKRHQGTELLGTRGLQEHWSPGQLQGLWCQRGNVLTAVHEMHGGTWGQQPEQFCLPFRMEQLWHHATFWDSCRAGRGSKPPLACLALQHSHPAGVPELGNLCVPCWGRGTAAEGAGSGLSKIPGGKSLREGSRGAGTVPWQCPGATLSGV